MLFVSWEQSIAVNITLACWIVWLAYWVYSALSQKEIAQQATPKSRIFQFSYMYIAFILLAFSQYVYPLSAIAVHNTHLVDIIGSIICICGFIITIWARRVLAGNWNSLVVLKKNHELIERGPYRFARHPIYSGILLMYLGSALVLGPVGGFIGLVILLVGFWIKLKEEEALMIKHFKSEYIQYMKHVKALVPYIL